jgi:hypothetical protein
LKKINKIGKPLDKLRKKERKMQTTETQNESGILLLILQKLKALKEKYFEYCMIR